MALRSNLGVKPVLNNKNVQNLVIICCLVTQTPLFLLNGMQVGKVDMISLKLIFQLVQLIF